jgi:hypothetical protein
MKIMYVLDIHVMLRLVFEFSDIELMHTMRMRKLLLRLPSVVLLRIMRM